MRPTPDRRASARTIGRRLGATLLATLFLLNARELVLAVQPNQLLNGNVQPGRGTTSTSFVFTVRYRSTKENEPSSVRAVAGNVVIPLSLIDGQPFAGRYRGSASLPAGSWAVVFQATALGNDPSLGGPTITVTPAPPPTATPRSTPRPTARPTPRPTSAPTAPPTAAPTPPLAPQTTAPTTPDPAPAGPTRRPSTATAVPSARATDMGGGGLATATPASSDDPPAAGLTGTERELVTILTGGLIAIGALALIGFFGVLRRRRRRDTETRLALLPAGAAAELPRPASNFGRPPRAIASWERDFALDEEPIGTVEYRPDAPDDAERG